MKPFVLGIAAAGLLASFGLATAQTTQGTTTGGPSPAMTTPNTTAPVVGTNDATMNHNGSVGAASGNNNQAVATTSANATMPAKGSNSFTMNEAKNRIEKNGFSNVNGLRKDNNGVWHASAQKNGTATTVWLDYKGNIGQGG